jgi:pyruvate dehydrogenase E2 component (dihydrolipoamide acetyltransferase)
MHTLHLPHLGQTMERGTILTWHRTEGEPFETGDPLYEVETEKSTVEVEAKRPGSMARIVAEAGAELPVGALLAVVADPGETLEESELDDAVAVERSAPAPDEAERPAAPDEAEEPAAARRGEGQKVRAMPKVRARARELGVDLAAIEGSGRNGAITAADVEAAATRSDGPAVKERRALTGITRTMADVVTRSWREVPQFTQTVTVDARALLQRKQELSEYGPRVPVTAFLVHALARAVERVPEANATFADDAIVVYQDVNVAVAVATDAGLMVPVLGQAQDLSLEEISDRLGELADRARSGSTSHADVGNATITLSNLGMFEVEGGVPLVTAPQAAVVFAGAIRAQPVVVDDAVHPLPTMSLSIGYDHRVLDGITAAAFTSALRDALEHPSPSRDRSRD